MSNAQASFPVAPSIFKFRQHGKGETGYPETLPRLAEVADDLCIINSFHTDAINHDPAATLMQSVTNPGTPEYWILAGLWSWKYERKSTGIRGYEFPRYR